ncbi:hypothetical protein [Streptomyces sp. NPDC048473]|uniref:hypothetical protein n=1 Tax=unclassified Streptomyces TaxID=2593676 RepID=UPI00371E195B
MRHLAQHAFSATPQTVCTARDFAMQALDTWGGCRRRDDIRACVSELAGNAVQNGSPDGRDYLVRDDWGVRALTGEGNAVWTCYRRPEAHTSRCFCTP